MLFSTNIFLFGFLPVVLALYFLFLGKADLRIKNIFLFLASLFFYAWGEPKFVFILIAAILFNWLCGLLMDKYREQKGPALFLTVFMLVANFGLLFVYKYLAFTLTNLNRLGMNFTIPQILLPIGISFFIFQAVSYVLDIKKGTATVQKNPLNVGLYIALFPQLAAGPIVRYNTIAQQIDDRNATWEDFSAGFCRFILGLGKKVLIADNIAVVADAAFNLQTSQLSVSFAWLGALAFALQIYFDFSSYSDMAIGLARVFGFRLLENFNYPYISASVSEFWRRWHISLSSWLRDYIYFPLGGSRVDGKARLIFNLLVVWLVTGIWHGANWTFLFWGLFYFAFVAGEKLLPQAYKPRGIPGHFYTMVVVLVGWVFFRSADMSQAWSYLAVMSGFSGQAFISPATLFHLKESWLFYFMGILFSIPVWPRLKTWLAEKPLLRWAVVPAFVCIFVFSVSYIVKGNFNPFIYFNF